MSFSSHNKVFIISDTHFGQESILTFKCNDGTPLRDFKSLDEMHHTIITNWNRVVGEGDRVIHLGDVAFKGVVYDEIMPQLNGVKYLVRGNHDTFSEGRYRRHFNRVLGAYTRDNYIFTHIPVHPYQGSRFIRNIHGHTHGNNMEDSFYFNTSVENINYTPVDFNVLKMEDKQR